MQQTNNKKNKVLYSYNRKKNNIEITFVLSGPILTGYDKNCMPIYTDAQHLPFEKRIMKFYV